MREIKVIDTMDATREGLPIKMGGIRKPGSGDVLAALRRQIISEQYFHDERLPPERELADQFGVARGTVREALKRLEELEFVERRPGSGTYVSYINQGVRPMAETMRPLELIEARMAIEPQIVRLAVLHANDRDLMRIEECLVKMEAHGEDTHEFGDLDEEFHLLLAEASHNSLLIWMMRHANEVRSHPSWIKMRHLTHNTTIVVEYNKQHRLIYDAIAARDPELAATTMRGHLNLARQSLIDAAT